MTRELVKSQSDFLQVPVHPALSHLNEHGWKYRYIFLTGGRTGGKTYCACQYISIRGSQDLLRVMAMREYGSLNEDSLKPAISKAINHLGLQSSYNILKYKIFSRLGGEISFGGTNKNIEGNKGLEDYDILFGDEAQTFTREASQLLFPTIRKSGSQFIFCINPTKKSDYIYQRFLSGKLPEGTLILTMNWYDNPFYNKEMEAERQDCLQNYPELYPHIWLGEPLTDDINKILLPYDQLIKCVDAHKKLNIPIHGIPELGLDLADAGEDLNAVIIRKGSLITNAIDFSSKTIGDSVRRANGLANENQVSKVYYDASGVGAGAKSYFFDMDINYVTEAFLFGGKIKGGDEVYVGTLTNSDYFPMLRDQAGWNIKNRLQNTMKLLNGEKINTNQCLFIDSDLRNLDKFLQQLSQPQYDYLNNTKLSIDKAPNDQKSPDLYDATIMAFASDLRNGLRADNV